METDADRRATIAGLGGQPVAASWGSFVAILDRDPDSFDQAGRTLDSATPELVACRADVESAEKGARLQVAGEEWMVKTIRHETPAPGWSTLSLRSR